MAQPPHGGSPPPRHERPGPPDGSWTPEPPGGYPPPEQIQPGAPPGKTGNPPHPGQAEPKRRRPRRHGSAAKKKGRRGCAAALFTAAVVLVLAGTVAVGFIWYVDGERQLDVDEDPPAGEPVAEHTRLPDCGIVESATLDGLVPDAERVTDETGAETGWEVLDCQWSSVAVGSGEVAGFAAFLFIRNADDSEAGLTGAEISSADLAADAELYDAEPVTGIGDEAAAWYNTEEDLGCVGAVTANMYTVTCYDARDDGAEWGSLPPDEATGAAEELARYVIPWIEVGQY